MARARRGGADWDGPFWPSSPGQADVTTWVYDDATGLLAAKQDAEGESVVYTYTPDGKLATRTWARGIVTTYTYDPLGQLRTITYSDETPGISYDGHNRLGNPTSVTDATGTRTYVFDPTHHDLVEEHLPGQPALIRQHDALRRSSGLQFGNQYQVSYGYDDLGRFHAITATVDAVSTVTEYSYVPDSTLLQGWSKTRSGFPSASFHRVFEPDRNLIAGIENRRGSDLVSSFSLLNDPLGRRTRIEREDGSYWSYGYDLRGQVQSGQRYWAGGAPVSGQGFGYDYDGLGNRTRETRNNAPHRQTLYTANALNQYTQRLVPGYTDVLGRAEPEAFVTVNLQPVVRQADYFHAELNLPNRHAAVHEQVEVVGVVNQAGSSEPDIVMSETGSVFLPQSPEPFQYDQDGNLVRDGRWVYDWNGENRLIEMYTRTDIAAAVPRQRLTFVYDYRGRRVAKRVYSQTEPDVWTLTDERQFVYDGWQLIREVASAGVSGTRTYVWGLDLSGSLQGAGGVGGLLAILDGEDVYAPTYDGNGNVTRLVDTQDGSVSAIYEYDPFGNILRQTGPYAAVNPYRFSTKYCDEETGLVYYGYRYYSPQLGRWLNRDPIEEAGGRNLYIMVHNTLIGAIDYLGLLDAAVQFVTVNDSGEPNYAEAISHFLHVAVVRKPARGGHFRMVPHVFPDEDNAAACTVYVVLSIELDPVWPEIPSGTLIVYTPHEGLGRGGAGGLGEFGEAMDHEHGHARAFFEVREGIRSSIVELAKNAGDVDTLRRRLTETKVVAIFLALNGENNRRYANEASRAWYNSRPERYEPVEGNENAWRKK